MQKTLILTAALIGGIALPGLALADAPKGAAATSCDPDAFVLNSLGQWNNPTCVYGGSGQPNPAVLHPEDEETPAKG
jgi:hypothetical protein